MAKTKELRQAREALKKAQDNLDAIRALPARVGARIRWTHNGVTWVRMDDDAWRAETNIPTQGVIAFSSSHVASMAWERVYE